MNSLKGIIISAVILVCLQQAAHGQQKPGRDTLRTSEGDLVITFIGHGSLQFTHNGRQVYVDPWSAAADYSNFPDADVILVTHEHGDHLDTAAIAQISKPSTVIFLNEAGFKKTGYGKAVGNGEAFDAGGFPVRAVPAYNIVALRPNGKPYHPKGEGNGYIISFADTDVYIGGDTELTPEMENLTGVDIAFLPIGLPYTMTAGMASEAARKLKLKIFYPYHFNQTDPQEVVRLLKDSGIEVRIRDLK